MELILKNHKRGQDVVGWKKQKSKIPWDFTFKKELSILGMWLREMNNLTVYS